MATLQKITSGRISFERMWKARLEICQALHGLGEPPGPIFRVGSNAPGATLALDDLETIEPCPFCGIAGDNIKGGNVSGTGEEYCLDCGNGWICGDYDWRSPTDCERFRSDLAAGLIMHAAELELQDRIARAGRPA